MQLVDQELLFSASDLVKFLACRHLTVLDRERAGGHGEPPPGSDGMLELVGRKGTEHEIAYLDSLRDQFGADLIEITEGPDPSLLGQATAATKEAMAGGAPLIYQAAFRDGNWMGYADFLRRIDGDSDLGDWSYEPIDTKLARSVKPYFVIQLCLYAELIGSVQGRTPQNLHLLLGDERLESLPFGDFRSYFRRMADLYAQTVKAKEIETYPDPVPHCERCAWAEPCEQRRVDDDHLSLVAGLGGVQAKRLNAQGIGTVHGLSEAAAEARPPRMGADTFERLRGQAALQVAEQESGELKLERLEPQLPGDGPLRGFARLPQPSPGDIFFDIEGDPFFDSTSLEYLWGAALIEDGELAFEPFWGTDRSSEKKAFEDFVDFVFERRRRFPDLHVYHYAPYERTALGRMMGLHGSRENEVDQMLREHLLVDLYPIVTQSLKLSKPSYSLKQVEAFYDEERRAEVKQAGDSVVIFEQWLQGGERRLLEEIEAYNREDCFSTARLRDWLLEQRALTEEQFSETIPWRRPATPPEPEVPEEAGTETEQLQARLLGGISDEPGERSGEQQDRWLLAQLLDYHRREAKPAYWQFIARIEAEDLVEADSEALGGMEQKGDPVPIGGRSKSHRQTMSFRPQEHKIKAGSFVDPDSCDIDPESGEIDYWSADSVEVLEIDDARGELTLKIGPSKLGEPLPKALIPGRPLPTEDQRAALRAIAADVSKSGFAETRYQAAAGILNRSLPRTAAVKQGQPLQDGEVELSALQEIVAGLERSHLFIQGPPGSGKTYTGAQLIIDLIGAGKTVGVTANSHKAICRLLEEVEKHATPGTLRGLKKCSSAEDEFDSRLAEPMIANSKKTADFPPPPEVSLVGGTAWLWCREQMRESVDYLVIDEAGQISLADALALSTAAENVILLGDPMQLGQVLQGTHPPGAAASVLEHLLDGAGTVSAAAGVFLDKTRRMHPDVCDFVSEAIYEDRLGAISECANQRIDSPGAISGTGLRSISVAHSGNSRQSIEEAEALVAALGELDGSRFIRADEPAEPLTEEEIMVVSPYNAQVRCIREHLDRAGYPDVPVGTVDKFQGQEAAVVFFSMATSSGAEIPRNVEFLYSRNRLNVAVSRARCLAILISSPELMTIECRTVEQMRLVNALCLFDEYAANATSEPAASGSLG